MSPGPSAYTSSRASSPPSFAQSDIQRPLENCNPNPLYTPDDDYKELRQLTKRRVRGISVFENQQTTFLPSKWFCVDVGNSYNVSKSFSLHSFWSFIPVVFCPVGFLSTPPQNNFPDLYLYLGGVGAANFSFLASSGNAPSTSSFQPTTTSLLALPLPTRPATAALTNTLPSTSFPAIRSTVSATTNKEALPMSYTRSSLSTGDDKKKGKMTICWQIGISRGILGFGEKTASLPSKWILQDANISFELSVSGSAVFFDGRGAGVSIDITYHASTGVEQSRQPRRQSEPSCCAVLNLPLPAPFREWSTAKELALRAANAPALLLHSCPTLKGSTYVSPTFCSWRSLCWGDVLQAGFGGIGMGGSCTPLHTVLTPNL
ncbi:hypothetical protein GYMLUDRAFT_246108 [Collybiopsis luxurians FD-317 M1]|uniref:Uncharacterized protein n=1 Tax=Collybiopsis luxurians FD-317 M1 TaxID=944289 RepID=A0A0D0CRX2_9AGAR|nr:hypothetical protein GYMLUDRAFT_246108 [Collybiopsis luxurians FD-317 M1]